MKDTHKHTIGELIENEVRRQGLKISDFAKAICCQRSNVYDIFQRNKMDINQLKLISKVLHRNFFKELAEDMDTIDTDMKYVDSETMRQRAMAQFFNVVPDVLLKINRESLITCGKLREFEEIYDIIPDFSLCDYSISFTLGNKLSDRIGNDRAFVTRTYSTGDTEIEYCKNIIVNKGMANIQLAYYSEEEWTRILRVAFEVLIKEGGLIR